MAVARLLLQDGRRLPEEQREQPLLKMKSHRRKLGAPDVSSLNVADMPLRRRMLRRVRDQLDTKAPVCGDTDDEESWKEEGSLATHFKTTYAVRVTS